MWFREIPTVTGNQNRAAGSCGCQIDLVVMVPETKRDIRRFDESVPTAVESSRQTLNELKRLQQSVARTAQIHPALPELAEILRLVRELKHFPIPRHYLDAVLNVAAAVKVFHEKPLSLNALRDSLAQLRNLRNALAHALPTSHDTETVHPAYSLGEDDDD